MRDKDTDHLDALIDDTDCAMTAGTPPASLRAAVRRRIDRPASGRLTWQMAMAAAAIAFAAFNAGRALLGTPEAPARPESERVVATAPPAPRMDVPATRPSDTAPAPPVIDREVARESGPLPPVQPIVVQPIALEPLADVRPVELEVMEVPMPLRAESVEIERLVFE